MRRALVLGLRVLGVLLAMFVGLVLAQVWRPMGGDSTGRVERSPRWSGERFLNVVPTRELLPGTVGQTLREQFLGDEVREPVRAVPIVRPDLRVPPASGLRVTWMGHATTLVEIDGVRVLTDPIWNDRCSPLSWAGPKRLHPVPIPLADLGPVDAVVVSHDHYDHLDMPTVRTLAAGGTRFYVPLGIGAHLAAWDVPAAQVTELDWHESAALKGLTFVALPSRHYSGRGVVRNRTAWASWGLIGPQHRAWFSGDTGWYDGMEEIGRSHGPFDVAITKIGAYGTTWPEIHATPEEALLLCRAVRGRLLLPVHWATFNLAMHRWAEPPDRLLAAARSDDHVVVPKPGQPVEPDRPPAVERWWTDL